MQSEIRFPFGSIQKDFGVKDKLCVNLNQACTLRNQIGIMAGNLTQHGMENFNGYDRSSPNFMIPKTAKRNVSPGTINTYAPGSPIPMKDGEQEYEMPTSNVTKTQQNFSALDISSRLADKDELLHEPNNQLTTNVDENVKDATIKHLNRHATMLQARVYQLEAMRDKLEAFLKVREQELARAKEHIVVLSQANHQSIAQQRNQNIDGVAFENMGEKEALSNEVQSLKVENNSLKIRAASLENEIISLRESMTFVDQVENSMMSAQACNRELESLHQVVDSLKSTVIQQRKYLIKLKAPQNAGSLSADSKVLKTARTKATRAAAYFQDLPCLRQGEEGTASPCLGSSEYAVGSSPNSSVKLKASALAVSGVMTGSSQGLPISTKNAQESVMHLAGLDVNDQLSAIQGSVYSDDRMEDAEKLNNPIYGSDLMYVNSYSDAPIRPHSNSPKSSSGSIVGKSASPKRDPPSSPLAPKVKQERIEERPVRRISRTEIIRQAPSPSLPVKSKTENLGYNPQRKSQIPPESSTQWQAPVQTTVSQPRWPEASVAPSVTRMPPTNFNHVPAQNSTLSSQYNLQNHQWPPYSAIPGVGDRMMDMGMRQATAAVAQIISDGAVNPIDATSDSADFGLSHSPREGLNSDRLCPVCNQEFGALTIDAFQSHVLECFDNESGPETMVAESPTPQRVCPMCNTSFGDQMSQGDFEKHVHSHFVEDVPGENFEVLQPPYT